MQTNHQPKLEPSSVPKNSDYYVHSKTEILSILREVQSSRETAALFYAGNQSMLTSVLKVVPAKEVLYLDCNINEDLNNKVASSPKVIFVSSARSIKVQFDVSKIERISFEDQPAFRIDIPKSLLRLQRREYYRIETPVNNPLICSIPQKEGHVDAVVVNISAGGIGVVMSYGEKLQQGEIFKDCKIVLPDIGEVTATIQIKSVWEVVMKNDLVKHMAGCEFIEMREQAKNLTQRYIMKAERDRRAAQDD